MRKIKHVKIGCYVLLSRWSDHDLEDPWYIGFINEYGFDKKGPWYRCKGNHGYFRNCFKITKEEADEIFAKYDFLYPNKFTIVKQMPYRF